MAHNITRVSTRESFQTGTLAQSWPKLTERFRYQIWVLSKSWWMSWGKFFLSTKISVRKNSKNKWLLWEDKHWILLLQWGLAQTQPPYDLIFWPFIFRDRKSPAQLVQMTPVTIDKSEHTTIGGRLRSATEQFTQKFQLTRPVFSWC